MIVSLAGDSAQKLATFRRIEPSLRAIEAPAEVAIGGIVAFTLVVQQAAREDAAEAELIALPFALLLTLLFFRGVVAALLPVAIGAFSLAGSAAFVRFGANFTEISIFAMSVGAFLGLGLSIDYALLLVQRFREELERDTGIEDAVAATLDTAGRAVWVSGLAVATSLLALLFVPLPVLRSVAIGGVLVVFSAMLGALLVLPALLAWLGPNVNRWPIGRAHQEGEPSPFWLHVGGLSMRHPVLTVIGCLVLLASLAAPVLRMKYAMPDTAALARDSEARVIDEALADPQRFDPGGASAIPVIVEVEGSPLDPANLRALRSFSAAIEAVPGVAGVRSAIGDLDPDALTPEAMQRKIVSEPTATKLRRMTDDGAALLIADNRNPWRSPESASIVEAIRAVPQHGVRAMVGGATAQMVDQVRTLRTYGPIAALLVALANFGILMFAFRSVIVPLKAVLMNALSLGGQLRATRLGVPGRPLREHSRLPAEHRRHRPDDSAGDVRGRIRPLDGLRGVPAEPDPGRVEALAQQPRERDPRAGAHGPHDHQRGADPAGRGGCVHDRGSRVRETDGTRHHRGDRARRDDRAHAAGAGDDATARRLELVGAEVAAGAGLMNLAARRWLATRESGGWRSLPRGRRAETDSGDAKRRRRGHAPAGMRSQTEDGVRVSQGPSAAPRHRRRLPRRLLGRSPCGVLHTVVGRSSDSWTRNH